VPVYLHILSSFLPFLTFVETASPTKSRPPRSTRRVGRGAPSPGVKAPPLPARALSSFFRFFPSELALDRVFSLQDRKKLYFCRGEDDQTRTDISKTPLSSRRSEQTISRCGYYGEFHLFQGPRETPFIRPFRRFTRDSFRPFSFIQPKGGDGAGHFPPPGLLVRSRLPFR